ncbi:MAG: DUF1569 domain-containing protein [Proteobacteria bacterium]|nr:DUF1569 domain-containing protein [Pseudomonadota bacterium]
MYDDAVFEEVLKRLSRLTPDSQPEWGEMMVAQMLAHCAEIADVSNGKPLNGTPFIIKLIGGLIKKKVVSDEPYKRNIRTHPQYVMSNPEDFESQRNRFIDSLRTMRALGTVPSKHPIFGMMTADEKGWTMYKHTDHHLTQFGV